MAYTTKPTFGDSSYTTRQSFNLGAITGASATAKWVAHAAVYLFGANALLDTIGTSTYAGTKSSQQVSYYAVVNTNTTGTAVTLATTTWGAASLGALGTGTTALAGVVLVTPLNTSTGAASIGGFPLPQGAEFYCQVGTDATAVAVVNVDYQIQPGAQVVA
jgi:hypothetical protein